MVTHTDKVSSPFAADFQRFYRTGTETEGISTSPVVVDFDDIDDTEDEEAYELFPEAWTKKEELITGN